MASWQFPWPEPEGIYATDGPREDTIVDLPGARYTVKPTGDDAVTTGRGRFRVECLTCALLLHENTTGASVRIEQHQHDAHGGLR